MPTLVSAFKLSKEFASRRLFNELNFGIDSGDHVGLIGPNGAGKSTLLKILAGLETPDKGTVSRANGMKVAYLDQVPLFKEGATIWSTLQEKMSPLLDDWERDYKAATWISELSTPTVELDAQTLMTDLSGGWKKKIAIAREWASEPDLMLMDEPTNHLDVETILWLEERLEAAPYAFVVITHDRLFLQKTTRKIMELDRRNPGGLLTVTGNYADYLDLKEQTISAQEKKEDALKNKLRRETEWLRRGPKARTTKQQARIDRAGDLMDDVANLEDQNKLRQVNIAFQSSEGGPKKLIDAKHISKNYGDKKLFSDFSMLLTRGSRIGLLGANGCGKSTLIKALLGEIKPDTGTVQHAETLSVAYFEQNRDQLDPEMTLLKSVCPQGDHVKFRGNFVHIRSYLDRFLFDAGHVDLPIKKLSGGEQARILIARLMLKEANILVLDEPTNDLDVATLDLLQEQLLSFDGAILLVTHDRYFLDQVATQILAFGPTGIVNFNGLEQWENWQRTRPAMAPSSASSSARASPTTSVVAATPKARSLTNKERKELEGMETKIHTSEEKMSTLVNRSGTENDAKKRSEIFAEIAELQKEIDALYLRWADLEKLK